jgi:hypothetical protein
LPTEICDWRVIEVFRVGSAWEARAESTSDNVHRSFIGVGASIAEAVAMAMPYQKHGGTHS